MMKFKGMIVGGSVDGGWLESDDPVKSIFKRGPLRTLKDGTPEPTTTMEKEVYVWVSGIHGEFVNKMWNNFWVPQDEARFIHGKYDDNGWAINKVLSFYRKHASTINI